MSHNESIDPFHNGFGGVPEPSKEDLRAVKVTLLPLATGAACLDGSPYGFYFVPSLKGSTKWTVSIEGGGWCYNETLCLARSKTALGSSKYWPAESGCGCMNANDAGTGLDTDCNCVYMPYGDGASFSGLRDAPWPVPGSTPPASLVFRGIKNFDASFDYFFAHLGLGNATEFVLTGGSAGGLSTFLHLDRAAERVHAQAPRIKSIRGAPFVGYFLDHDNFVHSSSNYTAWMKYIYHMQNLGESTALSTSCLAAFPDSPWYCFMSPHMQSFISTPFYVFNSKYDSWQLANILQTNWQTKAEQDAVLQYGLDFLKQFSPIQQEGPNGAFITSCICHGCPWSTLVLDSKTPYGHYAAWHNGLIAHPDSILIDSRGPNGNGAITDSQCSKFP